VSDAPELSLASGTVSGSSSAIVTGGASGLGAGVARLLVDRGLGVAVVDRNEVAARAVADELGCLSVGADVSDESGSDRAFAQIIDRLGNPAVLVCCAGVQRGRRVVRNDGPVDLSWFRESVEINLVGTFNWVRMAANAMSHNHPSNHDGSRGVIIMTSSITAFDGVDGGVAYAAAKAGVAGMTLPLARELAPLGVRVMSIAPGVFDTPMAATMPDEFAQALTASIPHPPRLGSPDEFALLVGHIIDNPLLNGEVIRLDGGLRMTPGRLR